MTSCLNLEGGVEEGGLQYKGNTTPDDVRRGGKTRPICTITRSFNCWGWGWGVVSAGRLRGNEMEIREFDVDLQASLWACPVRVGLFPRSQLPWGPRKWGITWRIVLSVHGHQKLI